MAPQTNHRHLADKAIRIPVSPPVDVSDLLPLIDHPLCQKLRGRKQLGVNHLVFPGAVHTRFEHSIGVLGLTQRMSQIQRLKPQDTVDLSVFAILHDLGHGPFSHQIEPILPGDHHRRCLDVLDEVSERVTACGSSPEIVTAMFTGEDRRAAWVRDRNLGTDKLDYLARDALHVGFNGVPDIDQILLGTVMCDQGLAIEEKFAEEIKRLQKFYSYLHQHGYLNKTALSVQRIFQRAVQEELRAGSVDPVRLWGMTDAELTAWLHAGRSPAAVRLARQLDTRVLHRSAVVIRADGYGFVERVAGKALRVEEWSQDKLRIFSERLADSDVLLDFEDRLSEALGLEPGDVLFAAMPYFEKLLPRDVLIYRRDGSAFSLFEKDRFHRNSLEGDYLGTFAIRLIVRPGKRQAVLDASDDVLRMLDAATR